MPALNNPRWEAFAQGRANGLSLQDSYALAKYKAKPENILRSVKQIAAHADIKARILELQEEMNWGATSDIVVVINELALLARRARTMDTAASLVAARGILAEIAKLKGRLGPSDGGLVDNTPPEPPMSKAEWLATYAPKG